MICDVCEWFICSRIFWGIWSSHCIKVLMPDETFYFQCLRDCYAFKIVTNMYNREEERNSDFFFFLNLCFNLKTIIYKIINNWIHFILRVSKAIVNTWNSISTSVHFKFHIWEQTNNNEGKLRMQEMDIVDFNITLFEIAICPLTNTDTLVCQENKEIPCMKNCWTKHL